MTLNTNGLSRMLLALGAALAIASAGCVEPVDSEDDDEAIASADQQLEPDDADGDEEGGIVLPGTEEAVGEEYGDPQPQPWRNPSEEDPTPDPGPDPVVKTMSSTPSGHGK